MSLPDPQGNDDRDDSLPFERLFAEISTLFINLPADRIDEEIAAAQKLVCAHLDIDRSTLWEATATDPEVFVLRHYHQPPSLPSPPQRMNAKEFFPWISRQILLGKTIVVSNVSDLPAEAGRDQESMRRYGTRASVSVPLRVGREKVFGVISFVSTQRERSWTATEVQRFEMVAQVFANALSRKRSEQDLQERLRFETLLTDISARFLALPSDRVDDAIEDALRRIGESLGLELCLLWQWSEETGGLALTHLHRSRECPPLPSPMDVDTHFPWARERIAAGETIAVSSIAELPGEAARDLETCRRIGVRSLCFLPLSTAEGPSFGAVSFCCLHEQSAWPETIVRRLRLLAQVFTNALARHRADRMVRQAEQRLRLITNALPVLISYVGPDLRYRFNNEAYRTWFGVDPEAARGRTIAEVAGEEFFRSAKPYLERALSGEAVRCTLEGLTVNGRPLSLEAFYVPDLDERGGLRGLCILGLDVTERNLALQEARRLQDELFHAGRVITLGELVGTLAHEISQPLSAIMSNAQAARRFLAAPAPDVGEVLEILDDIVKENVRAGEVITRLRSFLRKEKMEVKPLDLNAALREIAVLLRSDARQYGITTSLELDPQLPAVLGDKVQLQQVMLNLVMNAFEAIKECQTPERSVRIRTWSQREEILAAVTDSGKGIAPEEIEHIFRPFYTTKPLGLGLGLSLCRSIITNHRGRLWAENNPNGGATFYIRLPAAPPANPA